MKNRKNRRSFWAAAPAAVALLSLSGAANASPVDLESEQLDASVMLSSHEGEGNCKDGDCKDGECKDGECKDGECKDGDCKDGDCKGKSGGDDSDGG